MGKKIDEPGRGAPPTMTKKIIPSEAPQYHLPELPRYHLPELPRYHLPELPRYHLPELRGRRGRRAGRDANKNFASWRLGGKK